MGFVDDVILRLLAESFVVHSGRNCKMTTRGTVKQSQSTSFDISFIDLHVRLFRYATWLSVGLAARNAGDATNNPGGEWALVSAPEDFVLVGFKFWP